MAVNSMTGHGRGEASFKGAKVIIELNSVNHRQFDLRIDLPPYLSFMEMEVREIIHGSLARGSVSCRCHVNPGSCISTQQIIIDHCLLRQYLRIARETARQHNVVDDIGMSSLFNIPGVIRLLPATDNRKRLKTLVISALRDALRLLVAMRAREGRSLAGEINRRLHRLNMILTDIARRSPKALRQYRRKLHDLLMSTADGQPVDKKIIREIVSSAERGDIAEELERSRSHSKQFYGLLDASGPVGRTMDFLVQEMMREINTMGAKANDCAILNSVVKYKSELECIREQIQNIE